MPTIDMFAKVCLPQVVQWIHLHLQYETIIYVCFFVKKIGQCSFTLVNELQ